MYVLTLEDIIRRRILKVLLAMVASPKAFTYILNIFYVPGTILGIISAEPTDVTTLMGTIVI